MNEEIKEILDNLGNKDNYIKEFGYQYKRITLYDSFQLLDYITNLQKKYENAVLDYEFEHYKNKKANELLQRHNEDTGDIYYKYNNRFVKSELKERLSEVLNGDDEMNKDKTIVYTICNDKQIKMTRDVFDYLMSVKHYNKKLKEEIIKLQQENSDICKNILGVCIERDRLQQENNFLKLNNPEQNIEHFRIVKENKRKIDNLRKENKELKYIIERNDNKIKTAEYLNLEYKKLLQENERLKEKLEDKLTPEELVNMLNQELVKQNKCYKSRCKKAIELYKNCKEEDYCILSLNMYEVLNGSDEK